MQQPAPLDLRVNTLLAGRNEVLQSLQSEGMDAQATPYSPMGIRLKYKPALNKHALFLTGKFEVQDEGSQLLGLLLAPKRNDMVVDFCAGAGGKTLMLGAMMNSQGRLYAWDISEKRLTNLKPRLKRSGLSNVQPQLIAHENDGKVKRLAGKIDRVLVDAPCSGLGTLAPQSRSEIPPIRAKRCRTQCKASSDPDVGRPSAETRRTAGVCHLQPVARRKPGHRASIPCRASRFHPVACRRSFAATAH